MLVIRYFVYILLYANTPYENSMVTPTQEYNTYSKQAFIPQISRKITVLLCFNDILLVSRPVVFPDENHYQQNQSTIYTRYTDSLNISIA